MSDKMNIPFIPAVSNHTMADIGLAACLIFFMGKPVVPWASTSAAGGIRPERNCAKLFGMAFDPLRDP